MKKLTARLGEERISKLLVNLSLPATIGMMVNALYNLVDTIFVGRGVGALAIGGLTIAFPIQMVIMAFAQMIGIGAASAISRSLGAKDIEKADYAAGNSFLFNHSLVVWGRFSQIIEACPDEFSRYKTIFFLPFKIKICRFGPIRRMEVIRAYL